MLTVRAPKLILTLVRSIQTGEAGVLCMLMIRGRTGAIRVYVVSYSINGYLCMVVLRLEYVILIHLLLHTFSLTSCFPDFMYIFFYDYLPFIFFPYHFFHFFIILLITFEIQL